MSDFESCPSCIEARTAIVVGEGEGVDADALEEAFHAAAQCHTCDGKGVRRKPASYVCNRCGGSLCLEKAEQPYDVPYGLVETSVSGGYSSPHLTDCTSYTFSLCEPCLREVFDTFKVPPKTFSHIGGSSEYAEDKAYYERRLWRAKGGHLVKLGDGLCNATIECQNKATWRVFSSGHITEDACCDDHRDWYRYGNAFHIPVEDLQGLPADRTKFNHDHKHQVAHAWLKVAVHPGSVCTYFQYIDYCIKELGFEEGLSAVWIPTSVRFGGLPDTYPGVLFETGRILIGSKKDFKILKLYDSVELKVAHLLPQLPTEPSEDELPHVSGVVRLGRCDTG